MLSHTPRSRTRIAAGGTALAALALVALGATASGSRAAERLRSTVGERLHVALPTAVPVPAAPPAPLHDTTGVRGDGGKRVIVIRSRDDGPAPSDRAGRPPLPPMPPLPPEVLAGCDGKAGSDGFVIDEGDGGKRRIVICRRLPAAPELTMLDTDRTERDAVRQALDGVRRARGALLVDRDTDEERRRAALAGIDRAIAELEAQAND